MLVAVTGERMGNLVLVEPVIAPSAQGDEVVAQLRAQLDHIESDPVQPVIPDVAKAALLLRSQNPQLSESFSMTLARRATEPCDGGVRWRWDPILRSLHGLSFGGTANEFLMLLRSIRARIALIAGDASNFPRCADSVLLHAVLPEAERITLPGDHNVHVGSADLLASRIAGLVNGERRAVASVELRH
jgi:hypothetical protein